jgi:hypothetical protein
MYGVNDTIRMNSLSKELRKYGFAESSQEAIAQAGTIYGTENIDQARAEVEEGSFTRAQVEEVVTKLQRLWLFKNNTDGKMDSLGNQVVKLTEKMNELIKTIKLMEMNQTAFEKRLRDANNASHQEFRDSQSSRNAKESSREKEVQEKLEKPIDRNGVAPADVSIEKMFYYGNK